IPIMPSCSEPAGRGTDRTCRLPRKPAASSHGYAASGAPGRGCWPRHDCWRWVTAREGTLKMTVSDQEIISRFPVGYHQLHPNVPLNFQMNRFWGWVGEEQMLEELRVAAPRIASYADWVREMLELSDKALADGRRLPAAYYARMAHFFLTPDDPRHQ